MKTQKRERGRVWKGVLSYFLVLAMVLTVLPAGIVQIVKADTTTSTDTSPIVVTAGQDIDETMPVTSVDSVGYYYNGNRNIQIVLPTGTTGQIQNITFLAYDVNSQGFGIYDANGIGIKGSSTSGYTVTAAQTPVSLLFSGLQDTYTINAVVQLNTTPATYLTSHINLTIDDGSDYSTTETPTPTLAPGQTAAPTTAPGATPVPITVTKNGKGSNNYTSNAPIYFLTKNAGGSFSVIDPSTNTYNFSAGTTIYFMGTRIGAAMMADTTKTIRNKAFVVNDKWTLDAANMTMTKVATNPTISVPPTTKNYQTVITNATNYNSVSKGSSWTDVGGNNVVYSYYIPTYMANSQLTLKDNQNVEIRKYNLLVGLGLSHWGRLFQILHKYLDIQQTTIYVGPASNDTPTSTDNPNPTISPTAAPSQGGLYPTSVPYTVNQEWGAPAALNFAGTDNGAVSYVKYNDSHDTVGGDFGVGQDTSSQSAITNTGSDVADGVGDVLYFEKKGMHYVEATVYTNLTTTAWPPGAPPPTRTLTDADFQTGGNPPRAAGTVMLDVTVGNGNVAISGTPTVPDFTYNGKAQDVNIPLNTLIADTNQVEGLWAPWATTKLWQVNQSLGGSITNVAESGTKTITAADIFVGTTYQNYLTVTGSASVSLNMDPRQVTGTWTMKNTATNAAITSQYPDFPLEADFIYNGKPQSAAWVFTPDPNSAGVMFDYNIQLYTDPIDPNATLGAASPGNILSATNASNVTTGAVGDLKAGVINVVDSNVTTANPISNYDFSSVTAQDIAICINTYKLALDFSNTDINSLPNGPVSPIITPKPFTGLASGITASGYTEAISNDPLSTTGGKQLVCTGIKLSGTGSDNFEMINDPFTYTTLDSDNDGMPDAWELAQTPPLNPHDPNDAALDNDNDGLNNLLEYQMLFIFGQSTDPNNADTDGDGLSDGWEYFFSTNGTYTVNGITVQKYASDALYQQYKSKFNPVVAMSDTDKNSSFDGDSLLTVLQAHNLFVFGSLTGTMPSKGTPLPARGNPYPAAANGKLVSPVNPNISGDGINDGWKIHFGFDPSVPISVDQDTDKDGLTDLAEFQWWKNLNKPSAKLLDPTNADTDGDGFDDAWEVKYNFDPTDPTSPNPLGDPDQDNLTNAEEYAVKNVWGGSTNPLVADTDGDGFPDGVEMQYGSNPLDKNSVPVIPTAPAWGTDPHPMGTAIPAATKTDCTAYGKADGSITNTDKTYAIQVSKDTSFANVINIPAGLSNNQLPAGTYLVRYAPYDNYAPGGGTQILQITQPAKPATNPNAVPNPSDAVKPQVQVGNETFYGKGDGFIKNLSADYAIEVAPNADFSSGNVIIAAGATQNLMAGTYYVRWAETTQYLAGTQVVVATIKSGPYDPTVDPNAQDHPKGSTAPAATKTDVSAYGKSDGSITNTDTQYAIDIASDQNFVVMVASPLAPGASYSTLPAGTYYVRYSAYTGYKAGTGVEPLTITQPAAPPTGTQTHPKDGTAPNVTVTNESAAGKGDGSIKNNDTTYAVEVSLDPTNWTNSTIIQPGGTATLPNGTYYIRWAGTDAYKPSSNNINMTIAAAATANTHPKGDAEPNVTTADETVASQGGTITNNDTQYAIEVATNMSFSVNHFSIDPGATQTVPAGTYFIRYSAYGMYKAGTTIIVRTVFAAGGSSATPGPNASATPMPTGAGGKVWVDIPNPPVGDWEIQWVAAVNDMINNGIINGFDYGNGTWGFEPNGIITRAQFCQIIAKMSGDANWASTALTTKFSDITNNGYWGNSAISWCDAHNVVTGYPEAGGGFYFAPDQQISRQEMAVMINRFAKNYGVTLPTTGNGTFSDIAGLYGEADISAVGEAGIVTGYAQAGGGFYFDPQKPTPRNEAAVMLYRLEGLMNK